MNPKILIIGPSWVGDMVMSQSLYRLLKQQNPRCQIDVLAPQWCLDIVKRMPEVTRSIVMPVAHGRFQIRKRLKLAFDLRKEKYDQAIVLPNSWKSALIPWLAGIPKRTGWLGEVRYGLLNDHRKLDKTLYPLMVQRFAALGYPANADWNRETYPLPKLVTSETSVTHTLQKLHTQPPTAPILALAPGAAFGNSKRWPAEYFAEVANHYAQQQWQIWLLGSPDDQPVLDQIQQLTQNRCVIFSGNASLDAKIDLLSLASMVISNDSGLLHVAAALNRPTIGIYGSTTPDFTPPLGEKVAILQVMGLDCRPCFKRECPLPGDRQLKCLKETTPQQVLGAMERLLA
jgi:heptosyltransferase-2